MPAVTSSVRRSCSQTNGVDQFWPRSSRSTCQNLPSRVLVVGGDERPGRVVVDDVEPVAVQDWRRPGAHLERRVVGVDLVEPDLLAAQIECGDLPDGSEVDVDATAVGDRRLGGEAVLQVALPRRRRAEELTLPADAPGMEVDVVEHPAVLVRRGFGPVLHPRVVQPLDRIGLVAGADRRGHEDVIAGNHRRAPGEPRYVGRPDDVLGLAPDLRQARIVGDDSRRGTPKLQPLVLSGGGGHGASAQHRAGGQDGDNRPRRARDHLHRFTHTPPSSRSERDPSRTHCTVPESPVKAAQMAHNIGRKNE